MTKHTIIAAGTAAIVGAGAAAGAGAMAAPAHHKHHAPKQVREVRKDVRQAVYSARVQAFSPTDAAKVALGQLQKAHDAGTLTDRQYNRMKLRVDIREAIGSKRGTGGPLTGDQRAAAAKPVLDEAVQDKVIKAKAESRILKRLEQGRRHHQRRP